MGKTRASSSGFDKKGIFVAILALIISIGIIGLSINKKPAYSPSDSVIVCSGNDEDAACSVYSTALLNGDLYGPTIVPGLIYRMIYCLVNDKGLPNPRDSGLKDENIKDLIECKEKIMRDEYGVEEKLVYFAVPEENPSNPFTGNVVKATNPIECAVDRKVVLQISGFNSLPPGQSARFSHMIKCTITECEEKETVLSCEDYVSQGGNSYSVIISSIGSIRTIPDTPYNGGLLRGIIYVN